jgi:lysophospholipase L1-like esterase
MTDAAPAQLLPPPACETLCDADRLQPFFVKLANARRQTVRILQIGDSHTAGDQLTGAWRTALQARYGNAGRGVLAPGRPYQGYLTKDVTASMSAGWSVNGVFGAIYKGAGAPPVGLSGFSMTSTVDGATMQISADRGTFDTFTVCALTGPGAGTLRLTLGEAEQEIALAADRVEPRCQTLSFASPSAALTASGGPVTITSWSTERTTPGVVLSNVGTVGSQLVHLDRTDDRVVAAELRQYRPDLLVVAFGTNEAFIPAFSATEYEARLRSGLARLRRLAPGVPMLLLGAPDSATKQPTLQRNAGTPSAPCYLLGTGDDWRPTAALPLVQAVQRRVAAETGAAFWDWSQAMGGRCAATAWPGWTPPLMRPDRVHFTTAGAAEIARRLSADLDRAMAPVAFLRS